MLLLNHHTNREQSPLGERGRVVVVVVVVFGGGGGGGGGGG